MRSCFDAVVAAVQDHGLTLAIGTTLLLLAFAVLVRSTRSLSKKNALASTAMLAVAGYVAIAIVPLPRLTGSPGHSVEPATPPAATDHGPILPPDSPADEGNLFASGAAPARGPAADPKAGPAAGTGTDRSVGASLPTASLPTASLPTAGMVANGIAPDDWAASRLAAASPTASHQATSETETGSPAGWIAVLALVGAALSSLHLLLGWLRLRRVLRDSREAPAEVADLIDLPARTRVRIARRAVQPFCFGLNRATIVLPQRLAAATEETRFVLRHERAHLISGDTRARLVAALLRPVLFWHPLYWWLQHQLRFTSELLADDAAAEGSVAEYVRCMMTLSTHPDPAAGGALVATIFRRRSELFRRLEMMLQRSEAITHSQSRRGRWSRAAATLALVGICASAFGVQPATAQSVGSRSPAEESESQSPPPPRSAAVRKQVRELRAELKRLQDEITALRAERKAGRPTAGGLTFGRLNEATGRIETALERPAPPALTADGAQGHGQAGRGTKTYVVKPGDTLAKIAQQHYGTAKRVDLLRKLNPDVNPRRLRPGERLRVLGSSNLPGAGAVGRNLPDNLNSHSPAIGISGGSSGQRVRFPRAAAPGAGPGAADSRPEPHRMPAPRAAGANPRNVRPAAGARAPAAGAGSPAAGAGARAPAVGARAPAIGARAPAAGAGSPAAGAPAPAPVRSGSTSELAGLVTRCIELHGEVEIARINLQYTQTKRERDIGKVKLRTAEKQHSAMRTMLAAEMKRAEAVLARTRKLHEAGFVTEEDLRASEGKIALIARALK